MPRLTTAISIVREPIRSNNPAIVHRDESKAVLQRELNEPWIHTSLAYLAECRVTIICIRVCELRMVECVKEFRTEFKGPKFTRPTNRKLLENSYIPIVLARALHKANAGVAEAKSIWVVRAEDRGLCETARIDIVIKVGFNVARMNILARGASATEACAVVKISVDTVSIEKEWRQIMPCLNDNHARHRPTT